MNDPKYTLADMWEQCVGDREKRMNDEEFCKAVMQEPVFEEWERGEWE